MPCSAVAAAAMPRETWEKGERNLMCRGRMLGTALIVQRPHSTVHGAVRPMQPEPLQILWDGCTNCKGRAGAACGGDHLQNYTKKTALGACLFSTCIEGGTPLPTGADYVFHSHGDAAGRPLCCHHRSLSAALSSAIATLRRITPEAGFLVRHAAGYAIQCAIAHASEQDPDLHMPLAQCILKSSVQPLQTSESTLVKHVDLQHAPESAAAMHR
ncbi:hypothetical protein SVAN01_01796 [Stagonosporopsis vannaccii]|nr:hypothetical protein SVAN01_01796 [Stagonosporopsis vannaccii]